MNLKLIIAMVVFTSTPWTAFSQSCHEQIEEAQGLYEDGKFSECIAMLSSCKNEVDIKIQLGVHRLLALCYLELHEPEKAFEAAKKILTIKPTFKPSKITDPAGFSELINSVIVIPKQSFGLSFSLGTVKSFPQVTGVYTIAESTNTRYFSHGGFMFGTSFCHQLNKSWGLNFDLQLLQKQYSTNYNVMGIDLTMEEKNTYFALPVSLRYQFDIRRRVLPFVQAGVYCSRLFGSSSSFFYKNVENNKSFSLEDISSLNRRQKWDLGVQAGIGGLYKMGIGYLTAELNYYRSFANISIDEQRYSNAQLYQQYYFLDDDLKLHAISFTIGFHMILNYKVIGK